MIDTVVAIVLTAQALSLLFMMLSKKPHYKMASLLVFCFFVFVGVFLSYSFMVFVGYMLIGQVIFFLEAFIAAVLIGVVVIEGLKRMG
mgnify:CR=1 FL=1